MNYPALKGRGIPFGASSFSGFHPRSKGQGIPAAKIKKLKSPVPLQRDGAFFMPGVGLPVPSFSGLYGAGKPMCK
jgi:hypothetical protein